MAETIYKLAVERWRIEFKFFKARNGYKLSYVKITPLLPFEGEMLIEKLGDAFEWSYSGEESSVTLWPKSSISVDDPISFVRSFVNTLAESFPDLRRALNLDNVSRALVAKGWVTLVEGGVLMGTKLVNIGGVKGRVELRAEAKPDGLAEVSVEVRLYPGSSSFALALVKAIRSNLKAFYVDSVYPILVIRKCRLTELPPLIEYLVEGILKDISEVVRKVEMPRNAW